jgi:hypothetical protein
MVDLLHRRAREAGIQAVTIQDRVEVEDFDFAYGLYDDSAKVASFADGRSGYREWARRNGHLSDIHAIDDRYDHDVDELMA